MKPAAVILVLLSAAVGACAPAPAPQPGLAVDHCALAEYTEECDLAASTRVEQEFCHHRAKQEAMRIAAGIPPECREPKT